VIRFAALKPRAMAKGELEQWLAMDRSILVLELTVQQLGFDVSGGRICGCGILACMIRAVCWNKEEISSDQ